jgi:hypothetical protein
MADANGCSISDSLFIIEPALLTSSTEKTDESAPGAIDGAINLMVIGGTGPYTFIWSNGATTEDATGLAGSSTTYLVTITDANGCRAFDQATIQTGCALANTPCDDGDPTTYNDVEDGSCHCTGIPCPAFRSGLTKTDITCYGDNDGTAMLNPSGGVLPYTYTWSNGANTAVITDLIPSNYSVTIADANGCSISDSLFIIEPALLTSSTDKTDESAPGAIDGAINLMVIGGTGPYTFLWSNGATTEDVTGLAGSSTTYLVTITDANGCLAFDQATIQTGCALAGTSCDDGDPTTYNDLEDGSCNCAGIPCPNVKVITMDVSCYGGKDGRAIADTAGKGNWTTAWSNGSNDLNINDLAYGDYKVTISNSANCQQIIPFEIRQPSPLKTALSGIDVGTTNPISGSVSASAEGGTAPYAFRWSTSDTTSAIFGLEGNQYYHVTITDAHGCQAIDSIYLAEFICASLREESFRIVSTSSNDCHPTNQITIESFGDTQIPLLFSIDQGQVFQESPIFLDLPNGRYYPIVKDPYLGCQLNLDPITFAKPQQIDLKILHPTECNANDGTIINGNDDFEIALSKDGPWFPTSIEDLESGNYSVFARKPGTSCFFLIGQYRIGSFIPEDTLVVLTEDAICGKELGIIEIVPSSPIVTFSIDRGNTWYENSQQFQVSPGTYEIKTRTEDGCGFIWGTVTIQKSNTLLINELTTIDPSECSERDGRLRLSVHGDQIKYSIDDGKNWQLQGAFDELGVGQYSIRYSNSSGQCQDSIQATLMAIDHTTKVDTVQVLPPSCFGAEDGYIHLGISQDTGQYVWSWIHGPNGSEIGRLAAGNFEVNISDNYCTITEAITLTEPAPLDIDFPSLDTILYCQGQTIDLLLVDSQYHYEWFRNERLINLGPYLKISQEGSYELKARDFRGCSAGKEFAITYSDEVFHANFLLASMAVMGQPTSAIEISWPVPDEITWEVESGTVIESIFNRSILIFETPGEYVVRLKALRDGCMSVVEKKIIVVENSGQLDSIPPAFEASIQLMLFPNPNIGNFNVSVELANESDLQLRIYDEKSFLVFSDIVPAVTNFSRNIDLTGSPPGIYTLLLQTNFGWKSLSFVLE